MPAARGAESTTYFATPKKARNGLVDIGRFSLFQSHFFVPQATLRETLIFRQKTTKGRSAKRTNEDTHIKNIETLGRRRV
jgi:hypothetical protein